MHQSIILHLWRMTYFPNPRGLEQIFFREQFNNNKIFFLIRHQLKVIFNHYKLRIATAIHIL